MLDRIAEWKRVFETEENAITKALNQMAWNIAAYSCIVEMVRQAPTVGGEKQLNALVMDMLANGFWAGTMQGVRRVVEVEPIRGPRSVCSLGGLIADVRAARGKLTRLVYVRDIAGLEYNYHRTHAAYKTFVNEQLQQGRRSYWIPVKYHYELSIKRHEEFDWLSGVSAGASTPDDLIRIEIFDMLEARLDRLSSVIEHVNVDIAHAATEASRQGRILERWGLADAKQTLREIAEIAQVVGSWFCYSGAGTVLPAANFDQFAHLNSPLFQGDRAKLQEIWTDFDREAQSWHLVDPTEWMQSQ
ncbi:hypothetical protein F9Z43_06615 [Pseudomonas monteilii]|uniref:Uncharacterized protein n=1 Tax=Pseudomonas monteilii TaxID=76759 RepID=A0A7X3F056_9PSED|nr:hypothetical protein [Pseudomonas monteilii]MVF49008.1 hypothetical protein [Pseudomonas monteilii]